MGRFRVIAFINLFFLKNRGIFFLYIYIYIFFLFIFLKKKKKGGESFFFALVFLMSWDAHLVRRG